MSKRTLHDALYVLRDHGPCTPAQFARRYFPADHPGWRRHCKCGPKGSHQGSGLVVSAGCLLGKLRRRGWAALVVVNYCDVTRQTGITDAGRDALASRENKTQVKP